MVSVLSSLFQKKNYKAHIAEHYQNRINREAQLTLEQDYLYSNDEMSEAKISTKEIERLVELNGQYLIRLKSGLSLIIPKHKVDDKEDFRTIFTKIGVEYLDETKWEWK